MKSKNLKSKRKVEVALLILVVFTLGGALTILIGSSFENYELSFGAYQFGVDVDGNNSELRNVQVYYNFQKEEGYIEFFTKNAEAIGVDYPPSLNITSIEPKWIKTEVRLGKEPYPSTLIIRGPIYQSSFKINFKGKLVPNGIFIFRGSSNIFTDCKPIKGDLIRASTDYRLACMILELGDKYRCNDYCIQGEENCKNLIITQNGSTVIYMFIPDIREGVNVRLIHSEFKLSTYDYENRYRGGIIKNIGIGLLASFLSCVVSFLVRLYLKNIL